MCAICIDIYMCRGPENPNGTLIVLNVRLLGDQEVSKG